MDEQLDPAEELAAVLRSALVALPNPSAKSGKFAEIRQRGEAALRRFEERNRN